MQLDRAGVLTRFEEIALQLGVPPSKAATAGRQCFDSMARTSEKHSNERDRDLRKARMPVPVRPLDPVDALVEWLNSLPSSARDGAIINNVRPYIPLYEEHTIGVDPVSPNNGESHPSVVAQSAAVAPAMTGFATVQLPLLQRLLALSNSQVEDVTSGLEDGTYRAEENPGIDEDEKAVASAKAIYAHALANEVRATVEQPAPPKIVVVLKDGTVAQLLSDTPGLSVALVEYDRTAKENVVRNPQESGKFARGWAGICPVDHSVERAVELHALAVQGPTGELDSIVMEGSFSGQILSITDGVATQKIDREGNTVQHDLSALTEVVNTGEVVDISYRGGIGIVVGTEKTRGVER